MTRPPSDRPCLRLRWLLLAPALLATSCERVEQPDAAGKTPEIITTKAGVEMVQIPAGWFEMGSRDGQPDESPVHRVWIDAFLMDRYEVTQEHYGRLVPVNGSHFKGPNRPVEMISWAEAALYCNMRSRAEGLRPCYDKDAEEITLDACDFQADGYRLPTEAEWEYACRAGSRYRYYFGSDPAQLAHHAWYKPNADKQTHAVGQKKPNAWGLYDMLGNVAEWCNDVYDKNYYESSPEKNPRGPIAGEKYVLRGGAWSISADACRSAYRVGEDPGFQDACFARDAIGFRCVRRVQQDLLAQHGGGR